MPAAGDTIAARVGPESRRPFDPSMRHPREPARRAAGAVALDPAPGSRGRTRSSLGLRPLLLLLARDAEPGEGQCLQSPLADHFAARLAEAIGVLPDLVQGLVHLLEHSALRIADGEQELFGVRAAGLVGNILNSVAAGLEAPDVRPPDLADQFLPLGDQPLLEFLQLRSFERHPRPLPWRGDLSAGNINPRGSFAVLAPPRGRHVA